MPATPPLPAPELPRSVAAQIAAAVAHAPDRPIELTLAPEELGRVRLTLSAGEAALAMTVLAERPETLELMRRHIDQLAQEFRALGFGDVSFSFAQGRDGRSAPAASAFAAETEPAESGRAPRPSAPARPLAAGGLDLRL